MDMKRFTFTIIIMLACISCFSQEIQAIAGQDTSICLGDAVQIGSDGIGLACYYWTPATGLDDPSLPNPTASPTETTTYTLTVIGEGFSGKATSQVTVTVVEEIIGFSAITDRCCWKEGEEIKVEDFKFATVPPNLHGTIEVLTPQTDPTLILLDDQIEAKFKFSCFTDEKETSVNISVVNEAKIEVNPLANEELEKEMGLFKNKMNTLTNWLNKYSPCDAEAQILPSVKKTLGRKCCPDSEKCVKEVEGIEGAVTFQASTECEIELSDIPLPYFKLLKGFEIELLAEVSGSMTLKGEDTCEDTDICFEAALNGALQGVLEFDADFLADDVLEVGIGVRGDLILPNVQYCFNTGDFSFKNKPGKNCQFGGSVSIVGMLELYSLICVSFKEEIIPETCF